MTFPLDRDLSVRGSDARCPRNSSLTGPMIFGASIGLYLRTRKTGEWRLS